MGSNSSKSCELTEYNNVCEMAKCLTSNVMGLSSDSASLFISILLGLGLASVFRKVCHDRSCLIIQKIPPE